MRDWEARNPMRKPWIKWNGVWRLLVIWHEGFIRWCLTTWRQGKAMQSLFGGNGHDFFSFLFFFLVLKGG